MYPGGRQLLNTYTRTYNNTYSVNVDLFVWLTTALNAKHDIKGIVLE